MDNSDKLKRLILELPWLSQNKTVSIEELCTTFSISREQAIKDLTLLTFVGPSQFGGDLVDIQISDDLVTVVDNQNHGNSIQFTPEEIMVLISSLNLLILCDRSNLIVRNLYNKILGLFYESAFINENEYIQILNSLQRSLETEQNILIDYIDGRNIVKKDIPIKIISIEQIGDYKYLNGLDYKYNIYKSYRLDRILKVEVSTNKPLETKDSVNEIVAKLAKIIAPNWKKRILDNFNLEKVLEKDSNLEFELSYFDSNFLKTIIYSLGNRVKIKADQNVKSEILQLIKTDIERFS